MLWTMVVSETQVWDFWGHLFAGKITYFHVYFQSKINLLLHFLFLSSHLSTLKSAFSPPGFHLQSFKFDFCKGNQENTFFCICVAMVTILITPNSGNMHLFSKWDYTQTNRNRALTFGLFYYPLHLQGAKPKKLQNIYKYQEIFLKSDCGM